MNAKALCTLLVPVVAVAGVCFWPRPTPSKVAENPSAVPVRPVTSLAAASTVSSHADVATPTEAFGETLVFESIDVQTALEQHHVQAEFRGNGRDTMHVALTNTTATALRVKAEVGLVLESGRNVVVIVRPTELELAPGKSATAVLQTAATRSSNQIGDGLYRLTYNHVPRVELFLTYVQEHLELSPAAIQTAVLALTENLPLSSVSKFHAATSELKSRFNTDAFRADTFDVLSALAALRDMKVPDSSLAMTIDPQLRIEAMIDPLCRVTAMRYYGITRESEWAYWKNELLTGDPSTRHYALYGIARFYPEVAVEMLPKWARETKTTAVFRLSAIQALADTQRADAVEVLNQLAGELGQDSELGRAAVGAALALEQRLGDLATARTVQVSFRTSQTLTRF